MSSAIIAEESQPKTTKRFGTALQQFSQDLTKSLSRYQITEKLTDKNFSQWSQPVLEVLISLNYVGYLKKTSYRDKELSDAEHVKVKFILTTWMLGLMDMENTRRCRVHLTARSNSQDESSDDEEGSEDDSLLVMSYEPAILWKFLKAHHQAISESSLSVIDETLHSLKISSTDSIVTHMDKFNNLMLDYYMYRGRMSDVQSARLLIKTMMGRISETTLELIHQTVKPLTRRGVSDYLKEYESRNGGFSTASTCEANVSISASSSAVQSTSRSTRVRCSKEKCVGVHHTPDQCFSKPSNFKQRDEWIARKEAERNGGQKTKPSQVVGIKEITAPSASLAIGNKPFISFNCEYSDMVESDDWDESTTIEASPSIYDDDVSALVSKLPEIKIWGLLDTGATHHMFKTQDMFDVATIKPLPESNRQLTLAGGKSSLEVKTRGTTQLKAGDGSIFELKDCL